jgi:hypothetical protein
MFATIFFFYILFDMFESQFMVIKNNIWKPYVVKAMRLIPENLEKEPEDKNLSLKESMEMVGRNQLWLKYAEKYIHPKYWYALRGPN